MTRRQALAASSPHLLGLLGALAAGSVAFGGIVLWNVVSICKRRDEWPLINS